MNIWAIKSNVHLMTTFKHLYAASRAYIYITTTDRPPTLRLTGSIQYCDILYRIRMFYLFRFSLPGIPNPNPYLYVLVTYSMR